MLLKIKSEFFSNTLLNMDKLFIRSVLWCFLIPEQKAYTYLFPVGCNVFRRHPYNCQSSVSLVPSQLLSTTIPCSLTALVTFCGKINVLHSKQETCSDQWKCKIISPIYLHTSIVAYTPGMAVFLAINDTTSSIPDSIINLRLESTLSLCRLYSLL